jgi:hypothetical protein
VSAEFIDARLIHVRKTTRIAAACIADANPFALRVGKIGSLSHGEERRQHREKRRLRPLKCRDGRARQYNPDLCEMARQRFDFY